jgi:glycosyltransferase involved in cell wall biosynthesis
MLPAAEDCPAEGKINYLDDSSGSAPWKVVFAGALPPPITGMTAMTAVVIQALAQQGPVHCINWSRGAHVAGRRWKLTRIWGAVKTLFLLAARGRAKRNVFYYAVSHGKGMYYDLAIIWLVKSLGYRVVLHHHSYTYIDRRDWRAALLARWADAHCVHCELMRQDFLRVYDSTAEFYIVPPTIVAQQTKQFARTQTPGIRLGFLSAVKMAKGIDDVIATFRGLESSYPDVRLIIAGPCLGATERQLVNDAIARWPNRVEYRGPVFGDDKARFFADIDVFLFPTRSESWGIVVTEALAAGCPVIARARGCVKWMVRDGCGLALEPQVEFAAAAASQIESWIQFPEAYRRASCAAVRRCAELYADADQQLPAFVRNVALPMKLGLQLPTQTTA